MWLIDTSTLTLHEFAGSDIPPYVILSTLLEPAEDEITFQDLLAKPPELEKKTGFARIQALCRQAQKDGLQYAWAEPCADMSDSARQAEVTSSIFSWFQNSKICYVHLTDVFSDRDERWLRLNYSFQSSKWFTRGWALLELLAPPVIHFFDHSWKPFVGTRETLLRIISDITGIPRSCLAGLTIPSDHPIAERMSWASRRVTTRDEDVAYCLMGLFDVKMPIVYGEGKKAFLRLQEEIMKRTTDHSLLVWRANEFLGTSRDISSRPILAESPADFARVHLNIVIMGTRSESVEHQRVIRCNLGITIWAPGGGGNVWIPLWKTERQTYYRINFPKMTMFVTGNFPLLQTEPEKLCLEDVSLPTDMIRNSQPNSLDFPVRLVAERSVEVMKEKVEIVVALLDGKHLISKLEMFPSVPVDEDDQVRSLHMCHQGNGYYHGIVAVELKSKLKRKAIAICFAVSMLKDQIRAQTCRVLLDLIDLSSTSLEMVSASELAKICGEEKFPQQQQQAYESPTWRHKDQHGDTAVELFTAGQTIVAKIMFDAPKRHNDLFATVSTAFQNSTAADRAMRDRPLSVQLDDL